MHLPLEVNNKILFTILNDDSSNFLENEFSASVIQ